MSELSLEFMIDEYMVYCRSRQLREKTMVSYLDLTDEDIGKRYQHFCPVANIKASPFQKYRKTPAFRWRNHRAKSQ